MTALPTGFPVSLRPWPSKSSDGGAALQTLIQRVNAERGGFVNISEESLRQEIAEAEALEGEDEDTSDEEVDPEPDRAKELQAARDQMLGQLEYVTNGSFAHIIKF